MAVDEDCRPGRANPRPAGEAGGTAASGPQPIGGGRTRAEAAAEERRARAAEKLRENLIRRRAQVRARRKGEAETGTGLPASRPDTDGRDGEDG